MQTWWAAAKTVLYGSAFLLFFYWLALRVRALDGALGFRLPAGSDIPGALLMAAGSLLALTCIVLFVSRGRGTPALFDAPRRFVAAGPYQYVRNPMYLGGLLLLAGFGLWLRSPSVLVMAAMMFLAVHLVVILHEEPALRKRFAGSYVEYCGSVRRWIPGKARTALRGHSRDTRP